jgi:hypothetical protein
LFVWEREFLVKKTCLVLKIPIKTENKCVLNIVLELIFILSKYENRRYMYSLFQLFQSMFRDNTKLNLNYADTFSCMDKNYIWNSEESSCVAQLIRF